MFLALWVRLYEFLVIASCLVIAYMYVACVNVIVKLKYSVYLDNFGLVQCLLARFMTATLLQPTNYSVSATFFPDLEYCQ